MNTSKGSSCKVSRTLDNMGYSEDMVRHRAQSYKEYGQTSTDDYSILLLAGSKGEGLSLPFESDYDTMLVINNIICTVDPQPFANNPDTTLFQMESLDTPPGYSCLRLVKLEEQEIEDEIKNSLTESKSQEMFIASGLFVKQCHHFISDGYHKFETEVNSIYCKTVTKDISGPSVPMSQSHYGLHLQHDTVVSFYCLCPDILDSWRNRRRYHDWPTPELVQHIADTERGYAVPVGCKGSHNQDSEWRICFTTAEIELIHNMNDTQIKLYILLKMVAKTIIQPVCKDITSYVMKNVALWIAEMTPKKQFREELLIDRLVQALCFLKQCVIINFLPNYMIPERNLLLRKLDLQQRHQLEATLSNCIQDGGPILLKCEKLSVAMAYMYRNPQAVLEYRDKRDKVERLYLLQLQLFTTKQIDQFRITNGHWPTFDQMIGLLRNDIVFTDVWQMLDDLISPDMQDLIQQGMSKDNFMFYSYERLKLFLS